MHLHYYKATYVGIVMLYYVVSVINGTPVYIALVVIAQLTPL